MALGYSNCLLLSSSPTPCMGVMEARIRIATSKVLARSQSLCWQLSALPHLFPPTLKSLSLPGDDIKTPKAQATRPRATSYRGRDKLLWMVMLLQTGCSEPASSLWRLCWTQGFTLVVRSQEQIRYSPFP